MSMNTYNWRARVSIGFLKLTKKSLTCTLINNLAQRYDYPNWLTFDDWNIITNEEKKFGADINLSYLVNNTFDNFGLIDLGFEEDISTWSNNHEGDKFIASRLDRFMVNQNWINNYPNSLNKHLPRYKFGHNPILLTFSHVNCHMILGIINWKNPKRFEKNWLENPEIEKVVKNNWEEGNKRTKAILDTTLYKLYIWGNNTFGNIKNIIKDLHCNLQKAHISNHIKCNEEVISSIQQELD